MKLHEFGIGNLRAGARCHRQCFAIGPTWIGGHRIKMTDTAGRHNHGAGADEQRAGQRAAIGGAGKYADHTTIFNR